MKWSEEESLEAIHLYKSKPELWQQNHKWYETKKAIKALKKIARELGETLDEVYQILELQFLTYMVEREIFVKRYGVYTGTWFGYASCDFLKDISDETIEDFLLFINSACFDLKDKVEETEPTKPKKIKLTYGEGTSMQFQEQSQSNLENINLEDSSSNSFLRLRKRKACTILADVIPKKIEKYSHRTLNKVMLGFHGVLVNADRGLYDTDKKAESEKSLFQ